MKYFLVLCPIILSLAACQPAPTPLNYPAIRFANTAPIVLDVSNIEVVQEYRPSLAAPNVEHLFPVTMQDSLTDWANDRLKSRGRNNQLQFIIKDASAVTEKLPVTQGIKGTFTNDQAEKITANISVELRIYGERTVSLASTEVHATRSQTISERASIAERDQIYYTLTKQIMATVNDQLTRNIQQYFSNYIQYNN